MNDQDITVIITSFHSGEKIFNCIESINKDVKIIVVENHFHNIIKDRYGPPLIGEHNDNLEEVIFSHLNV